MAFKLPEGLLSGDTFDGFVEAAKAALRHVVEQGEVPEFLGEPMSGDDALNYLEGWLDRNKGTLVEGGVDYLSALARRLVIAEEPEQTIEEFEASLASFTDEQLVAMTEADAAEVEACKIDVIDRRRALLADLLETGKTLLRGAVATGLRAALELAHGEAAE